MPNFQPYNVGQNVKVTINDPQPLIAVGGDNPTPFYLFFPQMPAGQQWVFPFIYGFMYPLPRPLYSGLLVDTTTFPARSQAPPAGSTAQANLSAYQASAEGAPAYSAGTPSISATIVRWNINNLPVSGSQASATRAASPSVTHIADSGQMRFANTGGAAAGVAAEASILDGVSGSGVYLFRSILCLGAIGTVDSTGPLGPGLNLRGTPGNAMTAELSAGVASTRQSVSLAGYDQ